MITPKHKCIFIHTAKCAGSSVGNVVSKFGVKIDSVNRIIDGGFSSNDKYADFFKFSFVRNPWDRIVSSYSMFNSWRRPRWVKNISFSKFTRFALDVDPEDISQIELLRLWESGFTNEKQKEYIEDQYKKSVQNHCAPYFNPFNQLFRKDGTQIPDYIGRFENLQEDFSVICDKIDIPRQQLPVKNKSKHKHYTEYYDDETKQIVAEKYEKEIEFFGYKFGE